MKIVKTNDFLFGVVKVGMGVSCRRQVLGCGARWARGAHGGRGARWARGAHGARGARAARGVRGARGARAARGLPK